MLVNIQDYKSAFKQATEHCQAEFNNLRTGRASVQLLDSVKVEAYGSLMAINEVANISTPDPQLIVVKPWDKSLLPAIERGIQKAQLNLSPIVDKELIRVPVPALTMERRQEMVKILHQKAEEAKVMLRQVRADARKDVEKQEGEAGISEDDIKAQLTELEKLTKDYLDKIDELTKLKETELLTI